jgi:hypothetical protein
MNVLNRAIHCVCQLKRQGRDLKDGELWITGEEFEELKNISLGVGLDLTLSSPPRFAGVCLRITDTKELSDRGGLRRGTED